MIIKKAQYKLGFRFTRVRTNWNSSGNFCSGVVKCRYVGKDGKCDVRNVNLKLLCINEKELHYSYIPDQNMYTKDKMQNIYAKKKIKNSKRHKIY